MYSILTKEQKKELKAKYRNSKRGAQMLPRLNRLVFEGLFLIIFPVILIIVGIFTKEMYWWMWTLLVACIIAALVFLLGQLIIRNNEYENFLKYQNELKKKLTKRK